MKVSIIDENDLGQVTEVIECDTLEEVAALAQDTNWAPGTFEGDRRSLANFKSADLMVLDIDDGMPVEKAKEVFSGYEHIILLSRNHQKEKNGVITDRYRVITRLNETITTKEDYKATWRKVFESFPFIDPACSDASRFFYPTPKVYSMNRNGGAVAKVSAPPPADLDFGDKPIGKKGDLLKPTLDFLVNGAPAGHRHHTLVKAVADMREQGYTEDEVIRLVERMTETGDWTQEGLNEKDLATIHDVMTRPDQLPFREKERAEESLVIRATDLTSEMMEYLRDKDKMSGIPTGIEGLDKMLGGGVREGELTVLTASAKVGKSSLLHYLMWHMLKNGTPIGYASRELTPSTEVLPNLLSIETGTNQYKIDEAKLTETYGEFAAKLLANYPLYFAPGYGYFSAEMIEKWIIALKQEFGVKMFCLDHFHYLLNSEDHNEAAQTIRAIKTFTKKHDVAILLIVQPRTLREGEKPNMQTVRGGAVISQALDSLLIFERVPNETNVSKLTLEIARHKLAEPGKIYLGYDKDTMRFEELERETELHDQAQAMQAQIQRPRRDFRIHDA